MDLIHLHDPSGDPLGRGKDEIILAEGLKLPAEQTCEKGLRPLEVRQGSLDVADRVLCHSLPPFRVTLL